MMRSSGSSAAALGTWRVLAQSSVAVSAAADTNENTLATVTVPANSMGANGRLRITALWSATNNANSKTCRIKFGGTNFMVASIGSNATAFVEIFIGNRNATNSQVGTQDSDAVVYRTSTDTPTTAAVDTTADVTLLITGQKNTVAGDTITLESYLVELFYAA